MNFPKNRFTHEVNFRSNYFFLLTVIFGGLFLPQESQSAPIDNNIIVFIRNVLDDLEFWRQPDSIEKSAIDTHTNNILYISVENDLSAKNKAIGKIAPKMAPTFFKTADRNNLNYQNILCIFCDNARSVGLNSFSLASSVPLRELNVNDKYPTFEATKGIDAVSFGAPGLIKIGFFETLTMIGFGVLIGILKFLRLNHFAMSEVYSRNGEIVGAPMNSSIDAPVGTGFVATHSLKTAHCTPLLIPPMSLPGSVEIS